MSDIRTLRKPYCDKKSVLLEGDLPIRDPIKIFDQWFQEIKSSALEIEPNAMCLSTATKQGLPSSRYVLCKGYGNNGFKFFTHYTSRKGKELNDNPNAALAFYWSSVNRAVRIEGQVEKLSISEADEYFKLRPYRSQIGALCSNQSKPVENRDMLNTKEEELLTKYKEGQVPRPEQWGGYILIPKTIEFWQGQSDRIHDRIKFFRASDESADNKLTWPGENGWVYQRLAP